MAVGLVITLTDKLISIIAQKLVREISREISVLSSFRDDFQSMCFELNAIKCLLEDARENRMQANSNSLTNWLHQLQEFLDDAVDILEDGNDQTFGSLFSRLQMGHKIKNLKGRLTKIHDSAQYLKYATNLDVMNPRAEASSGAYSEDRRKKSSALLKPSIPVGIEADIEKITKCVLADGSSIIAIVGMGGTGKTLLLQNVFNDTRVKEWFDHLVWLAVSQKFVVHQLLLEMGKQIKLPDNQMRRTDESAQDLRVSIESHLSGKRVLFVFDDVWRPDFLGQIELKMDNIVVTTRHNNVAKAMRANHIHSMVYLTPENSWKLFCKHAFPDREDCNAPDELEAVARRIVEKCSNLPLAVKTIGAYMDSVNKLPNEWDSALKRLDVKAHMNDQVYMHRANFEADMYDQVMPTLRVSYGALPDHLKPCFLYCSAFPRNTQINCEYLVHAWIAEGFISRNDDEGVAQDTRYDVGLSYLKDLIDRCVIEVSQVRGDGREMYCKMHDLLHDLALSESPKASKCFISPGTGLKAFPVDKCQGVRRISMMKNDISTIDQDIQAPRLRTLLLWNNIHLKSISSTFFNKVRLLTVLDLSQTSIQSLPKSIGKLSHLKLLNLSGTKIEKLPRSLKGLRSLHFLDLHGCKYLQRLHSWVGKQKLMLHLNIDGCKKLEPMPVRISKLISLRTLKGVIFQTDRELKAANPPGSLTSTDRKCKCLIKWTDHKCKCLKWADRKCLKILENLSIMDRERKAASPGTLKWTDLKCLKLLENLSITFSISQASLESESESEQGVHINDGTFGVMTKMRTLFLEMNIHDGGDNSCLLHLPNDMKQMEHLEHLHLRNCVMSNWIIRLQNLMVLVLDGDNSSGADYKGIEEIPNLVELSISHNKRCIEFPEEFGKSGAFSKLNKLSIEDFELFVSFPSFEEGAMPMLKHLRVKNCNRLKDIPEQGSSEMLGASSILKYFRLKDCSELKYIPEPPGSLDRLASLEEVEIARCQNWEEGIRNRGSRWQTMKDRGIKIKVTEL